MGKKSIMTLPKYFVLVEVSHNIERWRHFLHLGLVGFDSNIFIYSTLDSSNIQEDFYPPYEDASFSTIHSCPLNCVDITS